ncbi:MAG: hypothetical protein JKY31_07090 [Rhodobacteraceae bacterium]|nr:hypothetical protein [Paracoccaceae bacterium]
MRAIILIMPVTVAAAIAVSTTAAVSAVTVTVAVTITVATAAVSAIAVAIVSTAGIAIVTVSETKSIAAIARTAGCSFVGGLPLIAKNCAIPCGNDNFAGKTFRDRFDFIAAKESLFYLDNGKPLVGQLSSYLNNDWVIDECGWYLR